MTLLHYALFALAAGAAWIAWTALCSWAKGYEPENDL